MRARRTPLALARMGPHRSMLAAVAVTMGVAVIAVTALLAYNDARTAAGVRQALAADPSSSISITGTMNAGQIPAADAAIESELRGVFGSVPYVVDRSPRLDDLTLVDAAGTHPGLVTLLGLDGLAAHGRLVSGSWPTNGTTVQVAVPSPAAALLGLAAGERITLRTTAGDAVPAVVSGIFTESAAASLGATGSATAESAATGAAATGAATTGAAATGAGPASSGSAAAESVSSGSAAAGSAGSGSAGSGSAAAGSVSSGSAGSGSAAAGAAAVEAVAGDAYWRLDPLGDTGVAHGTGYTTYGPLVATTATLTSGPLAATAAEWSVAPAFDRVSANQLNTLSSSLATALDDLRNSATVGAPDVATDLPDLLARLAGALVVARTLLLIGLLQLAALAGATLLLAARFLAWARQGESALLWARGGTRVQVARLNTAEGVLLALPAAVGAPLLAAPLAGAIGGIGPVAVSAAPLWEGTVGGVLLCICAIVAPSLRTAISPVAERAHRGRQRAVAAVARAGGDLALVLLAAVACWRLVANASPLSQGLDDRLGVDPVLVAAPVLAPLASAVIVLRVLPLVVRAGDRLARGGRRFAAPYAVWQVSRRPLRQAGSVLLAVLAVATAVLAFSQYRSTLRSQADQADFTAGADVRVDLAYGPLTSPQSRALAHTPGVTAAMAASRSTVVLADQTSQATVLAVDPATLPRVALVRGDLTGRPLPDLARAISGDGSGGTVPAIATAAFLSASQQQLGGTVPVSVGAVTVQVNLVAEVSAFPTITTSGGGLVLDLTALQNALAAAGNPAPVNEWWLSTTGTPTLPALPDGATVTTRQGLLAASRAAPLSSGPQRALLALALAAAALAAVGLALAAVVTVRERRSELALLGAVGASRRRLMLAFGGEHALVAGPAAAAGLALGALLARLLVPAVVLTPDQVRPMPGVIVDLPWAWLLPGAVALAAVPVAVAVLVTRLAASTRPAAALREGEGQ